MFPGVSPELYKYFKELYAKKETDTKTEEVETTGESTEESVDKSGESVVDDVVD